MSNRRVNLRNIIGKLATALGLADEEFETEVYYPYGFSSNPRPDDIGPSVLIEINGDPNNFIALPPSGDGASEGNETRLYFRDTQIVLSDQGVQISTPSGQLSIGDRTISTDMDIVTTGSIRAGGDIRSGPVSLTTHTHAAPSGVTSAPNPA